MLFPPAFLSSDYVCLRSRRRRMPSRSFTGARFRLPLRRPLLLLLLLLPPRARKEERRAARRAREARGEARTRRQRRRRSRPRPERRMRQLRLLPLLLRPPRCFGADRSPGRARTSRSSASSSETCPSRWAPLRLCRMYRHFWRGGPRCVYCHLYLIPVCSLLFVCG